MPFSVVGGLGADSLVSGAQIFGGHSFLTGATVLADGWISGVNVLGLAPIGTLFNLGGLAGLSGVNVVGATGASVVTLPWTLNVFGAFNLF